MRFFDDAKNEGICVDDEVRIVYQYVIYVDERMDHVGNDVQPLQAKLQEESCYCWSMLSDGKHEDLLTDAFPEYRTAIHWHINYWQH